MFSSFGGDAPPLLLRAAKRLERVDAKLARDTYLDAWGAMTFAGRLGTRGTMLEVSRAAIDAPQPDGAPRPSDLLLDSLATVVTDGRAAARPLLEEATKRFVDEELPADLSFRWGWLTVVPSYVLWDERSNHTICARQLDAVRRANALARLPVDLSSVSLLALRCGDFDRAAAAITEIDTIATATGSRMTPYMAMLLAGFRGHEAETTALIESVRNEAPALGQGVALQLAAWAGAVLCNGLGRYQEALAAAQDASNDNPDELLVSAWASPELLEAATRSNNAEVADIALERIVTATAFSRTDSAQGVLARSRALVSETATAERLYQEAIARLGRGLLRPELARSHLLYGEWLRRQGRRMDAREQLRMAYDQLTSIGMDAFADRARRELVATGEKVRKRTVETREDLTPQETQIARLARDGLSNAEIGGRLFISQHTVAYHLRKVFSKLDVTSRNQLDEVLRERARVGEVA
jgi:DNA-binding CsgD family transcriptional regulator/tetratricopeptide (TPR) repeat protein